MALDYFVWAIVGAERTVVVDTGFDYEEGKRRDRKIFRLPREGLEMIGVDVAKAEDVVVTHLHYDHAGTVDHFPNARFHLQEAEMVYATGRHMCHQAFNHAYTPGHICTMAQRAFEGRVAFHDGDDEIAPGVSIHRIGGHTMGMQCVRVMTARGWVVLASDATHYYENMQEVRPFPIVYNLADMVQGYEIMRGLASSSDHVIPGHDSLVMDYYPAPRSDFEGIVVRLDVPPKGV
jgi:glyoxylase-like metal-dependent hydrolase (beta-lactamase superfamily II)